MASPLDLRVTTVVEASVDHLLQLRAACHQNFAPGLEWPTFVQYWSDLQSGPWTTEGRYIVWVLVHQDDREAGLSFVGTQRRDAFQKDPDGKVSEAHLYAITFVVTPPQHRRRGYSHRLLRTLHYLLCPPENIGPFPSSWGLPPVVPLSINLPPAAASALTSIAPVGFYHACWIGEEFGKRPGWVSHSNSENTELSWENMTEMSGGTGLAHVFIYDYELEDMREELSAAFRNCLLNTPSPDSRTTIIVQNPASPGLLHHLEPYARVGLPSGRGKPDPSIPIGVRFFPSNLSQPPPYDSTQPLVLFIPQCFHPDEIAVTMTVHLTLELLPDVIGVLREVGSRMIPACPRMRSWGMDPDDPVLRALVEAGAKLEDRVQTNKIPSGVCWYGPPGTDVRIDGLEFWAWC